MKPMQQMGYLLAANFETLIYIVMAWWGARYLNEHYPKPFDWSLVTYSLGLLMILRSWYVVFHSLMKAQKGQNTDGKEGTNEKNPGS